MISRLRAARHKVTLGVQAMLWDEQRRVLLVRHGYRPGWHFPGGGVEKAESIHVAIAREVEEETGIALEGTPRLYGIYAHFDAFPGDHIVLFISNAWRQVRTHEPNKEIAEVGFFSFDRLPEGTTPQTRRRIDEVFAGKPPSSHW